MGHSLHQTSPMSRTSGESSDDTHPHSSLLYDESGSRKYLTVAERRLFLHATTFLPKAGQTFCRVLAYTGCRISEGLALTPRRVDLNAHLVIFECLKKRRRGVFRAVPVPAALIADIDRVHHLRSAIREMKGLDRPLWRFGRTTAWKYVKKAMAQGGIDGAKASPKGLRHTLGVSALQSGVPLNLIKRWLGHSRLSTTAIYAEAVGEEERQLARRLWKTFR